MSIERRSDNLAAPESVPPVEGSGEQALQREVQDVIGQDRKIVFMNFDRYTKGENRFLWGFTKAADQAAPLGFVKMAPVSADPTAAEARDTYLKREVLALAVAQRLGIPSTHILTTYSETAGGHGLIHLEALDSKEGTVLTSPELIAAAKPEYGAWMAKTLYESAGREIPPDIDTAAWKRQDERNDSQAAFDQTWQADVAVVLAGLPEARRQRLGTLFAAVKAELDPLIEAANTPDKEYFVHNDITPANTFFNEAKQQAILLDFERSGTTPNKVLAVLSEVSTFYGRCWPNPAMQQQLIEHYLTQMPAEHLAEEYTKLKGALVFGSTFFAKFAMDPAHAEHPMAVALLKNLEKNLDFLDEVYQRLQAR